MGVDVAALAFSTVEPELMTISLNVAEFAARRVSSWFYQEPVPTTMDDPVSACVFSHILYVLR
jgi:hypothetical protein